MKYILYYYNDNLRATEYKPERVERIKEHKNMSFECIAIDIESEEHNDKKS